MKEATNQFSHHIKKTHCTIILTIRFINYCKTDVSKHHMTSGIIRNPKPPYH